MNPPKLLLNNKPFSYEQIKAGDYTFSSPFEEATLLFCKQWLNGENEFKQKTSGSTGKPKLITITRAQMLISARQTVTALNLKANDVALVCVNTEYIAGKMMLVRAFEHKMHIIINEPSANPLKDIGTTFHFAAMVPMQIENVLKSQESKDKLANCKAILVGGAPVSLGLAEQIANITTPMYATYGMTETVSHIALQRISSPVEKHFTTLGDVNIKVNNKEQLIIKGAITNDKELLTNDRVQLLSSTTFKWLGRIDNVINSGGIKIQLEDVETPISLIFKELKIENSFFIAKISDETLGDKMALFIESSGKPLPHSLMEVLKKRLGKYRSPKSIINVEKFTKTASGKIDKSSIIKRCS